MSNFFRRAAKSLSERVASARNRIRTMRETRRTRNNAMSNAAIETHDDATDEPTVITDENFKQLVNTYFDDRKKLPSDLKRLPIGQWDVSEVTDMSHLFSGRNDFNEPLHWNVSKVKNMSRMFEDASSFNQPLNWNVSNVENLESMFEGATKFRQDLHDWMLPNNADTYNTFKGAKNMKDFLPRWMPYGIKNHNKMLEKERKILETPITTLNPDCDGEEDLISYAPIPPGKGFRYRKDPNCYDIDSAFAWYETSKEQSHLNKGKMFTPIKQELKQKDEERLKAYGVYKKEVDKRNKRLALVSETPVDSDSDSDYEGGGRKRRLKRATKSKKTKRQRTRKIARK